MGKREGKDDEMGNKKLRKNERRRGELKKMENWKQRMERKRRRANVKIWEKN